MSGPVCRRCSCPSLESVPGKGAFSRCPYCGWEGDVSKQPRKILYPESYSEWAEKLEKKRRGNLFILAVEFDPDSDAVSGIMEILHLKSMGYAGGSALIELDAKPDAATLEGVKAVSGVKSARLV